MSLPLSGGGYNFSWNTYTHKKHNHMCSYFYCYSILTAKYTYRSIYIYISIISHFNINILNHINVRKDSPSSSSSSRSRWSKMLHHSSFVGLKWSHHRHVTLDWRRPPNSSCDAMVRMPEDNRPSPHLPSTASWGAERSGILWEMFSILF